MNVAAISVTGHESTISIISNGKLVSNIIEERLSGIKLDEHLFLAYHHLKKFHEDKGLDLIVLTNGTEQEFAEMNRVLKKYKLSSIQIIEEYDEHHLYHAASGFYASGFDEAVVLVVDGWGADYRIHKVMEMSGISLSEEDLEDAMNYQETMFLETTSVYHASYPANFDLLHKQLLLPSPQPRQFIESSLPIDFFEAISGNGKISVNSAYDIGIMYGTITHHLGWYREECGKTMGLAAYGKENSELPPFILEHNDVLFANMNLFHSNRIVNITNYPEMIHKNDFQKKADIAYKIQKTTEYVISKKVERILDEYPLTKNIIFSGGVALNICANSIVKEKFPDINFFVDPIAGDLCQAYGASKYFYHKKSGSKEISPLETTYYGLEYNPKLMKTEIEYEVLKKTIGR